MFYCGGRTVIAGGLALLAVAWCAAPAGAQEDLEKARVEPGFKAINQRFIRMAEANPKFDPKDKNDVDAVKMAAEKFVYQFTWKDTYRIKPGAAVEMATCQRQMEQAAKTPGTQAFLDAFSGEVVQCIKKVWTYPVNETNRQYCTNVALLLPVVARGKSEVFADFLAEVVADPKQNPLYRFCAVKGLREYFPVAKVQGEDAKDQKRQRAIQRVDAVIAYITQDWGVPAERPDDPRGRELYDAAIFQRREGVRTLALAGAAVVDLEKNNNKAVKANGPAVVTLLRVLSKGGLTPTPSLAERCEAAIGICQLQGSTLEAYQSPLAVALVGQALVDFCEGYNKDFDAVSTKKIPLLPWKIYADRLEAALKDFDRNLPRETPGQQKALEQVKLLYRTAGTVLGNIKSTPPKTIDKLGDLRTVVDALPAPPGPVIEGLPATAIKGGKGG
jgi:hypothetical protein